MDANQPPRESSHQTLEQFRARTPRLQIHPLELALLWILSAHLVFLPWAIGDMRLWGHWISLVVSVIGFVVALVPRNYRPEHTGANSFRLLPWPKLLRFPIFWFGLLLLGLVTTQALNPAWEYQTNGVTWWMRGMLHVDWLPPGVRVPFERWGPWRMLMIYSSAWLTVCAIWIGFTRRRSIQRLLLTLSINGVLLAILGVAERMFGNGKIFWIRDSENAAFFSSFVYKNHAGGYLFLTLAVTCGLAAWHFLRGVRRLEKSNPSAVFAFLATCIAVSVLISYARGATFTMLAYLSLVVAGFVIQQIRLPKESRRPVIMIALLLIFAFFLKTGMDALHSELAWDRLRGALSGNDLSVEARETANKASLEMLQDHWLAGTGTGSFQFLYPLYQQHYPAIWQGQFWRHAHNDLLEFPIELGLAGVLIVVASFLWWGLFLLRNYAWQNPLTASVILGCLFMVGMSAGDFMFQNPAILITWCALWPAAALWSQMEEQRARA